MSSSEPPLVFLRDLADVEPPRDRYAHYESEDIYRLVPRPQWTGLEDEIWTPRSQEHDPQLEKVKALMKRNSQGNDGDQSPSGQAFSATKFATKLARKKRKNPRVKVRACLNNKFVDLAFNMLIIWVLFMEDIRVLCTSAARRRPEPPRPPHTSPRCSCSCCSCCGRRRLVQRPTVSLPRLALPWCRASRG